MISRWPFVIGSKDPGHTTRLISKTLASKWQVSHSQPQMELLISMGAVMNRPLAI